MNKKVCVLVSGFLVFCLGLGCEKEGDASQPVIHLSERVKIVRPAKPKPIASEIKPVVEKAPAIPVAAAPEKMADADQKTVSSEAAQAGKIEQKVVHKSEPAPPSAASIAPVPEKQNREPDPLEKKAEDPLQLNDNPNPGDVSDLLGGKEALFGDQEKYYVKKGRVDPFEPFLHKPEPKTEMVGTKEPQRRTPRTPLERIALGQLKLTAVMQVTSEQLKMAMVEDANGKGYIVKIGTYIGENGGRVSEIKENKVIVEEQYNDVFGKTSKRQIELKLQKQAGE